MGAISLRPIAVLRKPVAAIKAGQPQNDRDINSCQFGEGGFRCGRRRAGTAAGGRPIQWLVESQWPFYEALWPLYQGQWPLYQGRIQQQWPLYQGRNGRFINRKRPNGQISGFGLRMADFTLSRASSLSAANPSYFQPRLGKQMAVLSRPASRNGHGIKGDGRFIKAGKP